MPKNSLGVLRGSSGRTGEFRIVDDFPLMLRLSKHPERFSAACEKEKPQNDIDKTV
jgi:hypothetical protein